MRTLFLTAWLVLASMPAAAATVDLDRFLKEEVFTEIKISPTGEYVAATAPVEAGTALAVFRVADMQMVGSFRPLRNNHVGTFDWVSRDRLLVGLGVSDGPLDRPGLTGELFAVSADGKEGKLLVGFRSPGRGRDRSVMPADSVMAFLADDLRDDDSSVLVAVTPIFSSASTQVERMDVLTGRRTAVAQAPMAGASFTTDNQGNVRFARARDADNKVRLYYRQGEGSPWVLVNDEAASGHLEVALGFDDSGAVAYLQVEQAEGPDAIVAWNPASGERREVLRDTVLDPAQILLRPGTRQPVGALFLGEAPRTRFFDEASPEARLYRSLQAGLGAAVVVTSSTHDGQTLLVESWSGSNPGDVYLYNTTSKAARHLISRSEWIDPAEGASVRPIQLDARDGRALRGFVTVPHGRELCGLPMVVMPHGGPFGEFDKGGYDAETQMLAAAGYAVLQVNFRGSSGYGREHLLAGQKQWGRAMQDDVTDATRWAIAQGWADAGRICIYGASYGAYAAMMGAAREPGLYRCAAGFAGVYDLPLMHVRGDIRANTSGKTYLREWLGDANDLARWSPVNLSAQVKVPVLLAAGRDDQRAPPVHTERMTAALKKAGVPVQTLYYRHEGHGLYRDANRRDYFTHLLAFLADSLGGATAGPVAAPARRGSRAP
ncbi:peptidase S9 [Stenotrophomonas sp. ESTM1D_MKCIP4_1]|uniref:alpha/beta hydrolase family protein n=1 Tax=Stenotrophomonas sp. ESTM1D_MKCIP4_1 TaxID=2072414 RepID=UPI000D53D03A|nr:prolyl oligopeptidase family serine peptidase [Stenotrophomonas sp. ESTM1D_MKCIP4_1]AWH52686.1 peptidase S9 [Stenotrophomonas sp. ESTM1D_MKCIP4_1]